MSTNDPVYKYDPDGRDPRIKERLPLEKKSYRKWIIIALVALTPWLAVAGCSLKQSTGFNTGFIPTPVTKTVTELPAIIVTAPKPKRVTRPHRPVVHQQVQAAEPAPACNKLDLICAVIVATK